MTMSFYLVSVFILSSLYAFIITTKPGKRFTDLYPWLAFAFGEMIIILHVAVIGSINATDLFMLNAAGAVPMVARWAYLDIVNDNRRTLRTIYGETEAMAGQRRTTED